MALEIEKLNMATGLEVSNVYAKVIGHAFDTQGETMGISVGYYVSKEAADAKLPPLDTVHLAIGPQRGITQHESKDGSGRVVLPKIETPTYAELTTKDGRRIEVTKAVLYELLKEKVPNLIGSKDV